MRSDERGFTLVELLVAMSMMVVITGATVALFFSTLKDQARVTHTADQVGEARTALRRIVDDVRQASSGSGTASELKVKTYVHSASCTTSASPSATAISCEVIYKCALETSKTTYQCTRAVGGGTAVKIVGKLSNNSVFTYTPTTTPTYIAAKLVFPGSSGTATNTFENGATLRNSPTVLGY
ncbi:MAG: hypothetical protein QOF85_358 [Solirubrobacterales bacterium]|nr:hypothetical protein [Solirubrobacterales bacterium]